MADPLLYDVVDTLYNSVMDHMPEVLRERSMLSAAVLGSGGIYGVVRGLQSLSKRVVDKVVNGFHDRFLPVAEKACMAAMTGTLILYAAIDPEGFREIVSQHPTYTSGMAGVYVGSMLGAAQDLLKRRNDDVKNELKSLESEINSLFEDTPQQTSE